jgi:hypothetical protein
MIFLIRSKYRYKSTVMGAQMSKPSNSQSDFANLTSSLQNEMNNAIARGQSASDALTTTPLVNFSTAITGSFVTIATKDALSSFSGLLGKASAYIGAFVGGYKYNRAGTV